MHYKSVAVTITSKTSLVLCMKTLKNFKKIDMSIFFFCQMKNTYVCFIWQQKILIGMSNFIFLILCYYERSCLFHNTNSQTKARSKKSKCNEKIIKYLYCKCTGRCNYFWSHKFIQLQTLNRTWIIQPQMLVITYLPFTNRNMKAKLIRHFTRFQIMHLNKSSHSDLSW